MYKAVIFDLDGTLLNTLDDLAASVNFALGQCGYEQKTTEQVKSYIGNGVVRLMQRATPPDIGKEQFERCFGLFKSHYLEHMNDSTRCYDGVESLLSQLAELGIKTAVVSNKLHAAVLSLCRRFFPTVDCCLGVSDESERKPSPTNVLKALELLGVSKHEAVYVGDSEVDLLTAENAGLECVCVTWGYRSARQLREHSAKTLVENTRRLYELLTAPASL